MILLWMLGTLTKDINSMQRFVDNIRHTINIIKNESLSHFWDWLFLCSGGAVIYGILAILGLNYSISWVILPDLDSVWGDLVDIW